MAHYLDFEKPLAEIEGKAEELRAMARQNEEMDVEKEAENLDLKAQEILVDLYKNLTPWRKCQIARHPERPHCKDYIKALFSEFVPLAGDRNFADDQAVIGGLARFGEGQSEAIARSTEKCLQIGVPLISVIIGEGGSGGAVAFATANKVAMLEHSVYSVISPEGCASILWKDAEKMREAAEALRLTADDLYSLGISDQIIAEPVGGAHRDPEQAIDAVKSAIASMLSSLKSKKPKDLISERRKKFLKLGEKGLAA